MTPLSVACIVLGCYYAGLRFPLAVAPRRTARLLRVLFGSEMSTRLFGIAWLVPWVIVVWFVRQLETDVAGYVLFWGVLGTVFSLYIIIFARRYSKQMLRQLDDITAGIRVFALMTAFLGALLIYLGIGVF